VSGWDATPIENHLFAVRLDGSGCSQLTSQSGWHDTVVDVASRRYLDYYSSATTPPSLILSDLHEQATTPTPGVTIWAEEFANEHPYAPYLPLHATANFGALTAEDGQTLYYRLTPPAEISGSHATVVYVYGGPGPQKARDEWSPLLLQLFAQQGFAVLEIDNRGSGNRGRIFEAPIYHQMGSVEVRDQVAGLAALDDHSWADKSRVGVFGHSYGGYMTLMCLSQASEHFRAGVAVAPVSDWALYDTHYTERYMGLPDENAEGYRQANVLTHLDRLHAPLLLMHGMADDNVLFTHSTMIMAKLQQLGQPFELMTYPGAKHSMQERDVSIHRFNMILDFFKRHL
jgi:dipeptidyl-peptidase-4